MNDFQGLPPELFSFYQGLEKDNSKEYWEANKETWDTKIQEPAQDLLAELDPEYGPLRIFRPQRDVRFSKDKTPYKTWLGVTSTPTAVGGIGFFLRVEASGVRIAAGAMVLARDQLERFREALDDSKAAGQFTRVANKLESEGLPVGPGRQPTLQRVPSGFPKDHPRADLLRWKGAVVIKEYETAKWMHTPEAADRVREVWHAAKPLKSWIDKHVGPSEEKMRGRG